MSEDAPTLGLSTQELWQWAQALSLIRDALARARSRNGRLAHAHGEHAARADDAREIPAVREMTEEESQRWLTALDLHADEDDPFAHTPGKPLHVVMAPLPTADGHGLLDQWGVWASALDRRGQVTTLARVVCRDREDADGVRTYLQAHPTAEEVARLHGIATTAPPGALSPEQRLAISQQRPDAQLDAHSENPGAGRGNAEASARRLSVAEWEQALRAHLPDELADRIIVTDPAHPHYGAWRELYARAAHEVGRIGADPGMLARAVRDVPTWTAAVRKPPAVAYWALDQVRSTPGYEKLMTEGNGGTGPASDAEDREWIPTRVDELHTHHQALAWARNVRPDNDIDRLAAQQVWGRFGSDVDAILTTKFPKLLDSLSRAAKRQRSNAHPAADQTAVNQDSRAEKAVVIIDHQPDEQDLLDYVDRLSPDQPGHRLAARTVLGRSTTAVDQAVIARFGDDERIAQRFNELHNDGAPTTADDQATTLPPRSDDEPTATAQQLGTGDRDSLQRRNPARAAAAEQHATTAAHQGADEAQRFRNAVTAVHTVWPHDAEWILRSNTASIEEMGAALDEASMRGHEPIQLLTDALTASGIDRLPSPNRPANELTVNTTEQATLYPEGIPHPGELGTDPARFAAGRIHTHLSALAAANASQDEADAERATAEQPSTAPRPRHAAPTPPPLRRPRGR